MRGISGALTKEISSAIGDQPVGRAEPVPIGSYSRLVQQVAELSYLNKDHLLFFRGQARDYRNKADGSTIYPSLYRGERVTSEQLDFRLSILDASAARLRDLFEAEGLRGHRDVRRRRYVQWSILQHYEVCPTPLLDLTHSLLVACSFAYLSAGSEGGDPHVFVFGLPYLTNRISINSEHDIVNVRLLSICPPEALRPYFQEGYVAGTDELLRDFESKSELDFNNRLIAKFRLSGGRESFWAESVQPYSKEVLFPAHDRVQDLCQRIIDDSETGLSSAQIGNFLKQWTELESRVMTLARASTERERVYSLREAVDVLLQMERIPSEVGESIHRVRRVRNDVVHRPSKVSAYAVGRNTASIRGLLLDLEQAEGWAS